MKFVTLIAALFVSQSVLADNPPRYMWFSVKTDLHCTLEGVFETQEAFQNEMSVMMVGNSGIGNHKHEIGHLVTNFMSLWFHPEDGTYTMKFSTIVGKGMNSENAFQATVSHQQLATMMPLSFSGEVTLHESGETCKVTTRVGPSNQQH